MPDTTPAPTPNNDDTSVAKSPNVEVAPNTIALGPPVNAPENKNDVDAAMGKLVNLLDINTPASELSTTNKLTMQPLDKKNKQKGKYDNDFFGATPTLGEMKAFKAVSQNFILCTRLIFIWNSDVTYYYYCFFTPCITMTLHYRKKPTRHQ